MSKPPGPNDVGLKLVIFYKAVKGGLWLVLALILGLGAELGLADVVSYKIDAIHSHLTRAWSIEVAEKLFEAATKKHFLMASVALALDGSLTAFEGWGLHRRKRWAPWLVVVASGLLLPVEIYSIVHRGLSWARVSVLTVNLAIVVYLAQRIAREHSAHVAAEHAAQEQQHSSAEQGL